MVMAFKKLEKLHHWSFVVLVSVVVCFRDCVIKKCVIRLALLLKLHAVRCLVKIVVSCSSNCYCVLIFAVSLLHRCCAVIASLMCRWQWWFCWWGSYFWTWFKKMCLGLMLLTLRPKNPVCFDAGLLHNFHPWKLCCCAFLDDVTVFFSIDIIAGTMVLVFSWEMLVFFVVFLRQVFLVIMLSA